MAALVLELTAVVELAAVTPKDGSPALVCDADEAAVVDGFKDSEREVVLPVDDAAVPKPLNPEVGANAIPCGADAVNAGNVKPELALVPVEDAVVAAGAEEVVVVVVVTFENRAA